MTNTTSDLTLDSAMLYVGSTRSRPVLDRDQTGIPQDRVTDG